MKGPIYTKNENGEIRLADICKNCAFYMDDVDDCGIQQCVVLECLDELNEEETNTEE